MSLFLHFENTAGDHISDVCQELQTVADKVGVIATSDFNGVKVYAQPGGNAEVLRHNWYKSFSSTDDYKSAWSK